MENNVRFAVLEYEDGPEIYASSDETFAHKIAEESDAEVWRQTVGEDGTITTQYLIQKYQGYVEDFGEEE